MTKEEVVLKEKINAWRDAAPEEKEKRRQEAKKALDAFWMTPEQQDVDAKAQAEMEAQREAKEAEEEAKRASDEHMEAFIEAKEAGSGTEDEYLHVRILEAAQATARIWAEVAKEAAKRAEEEKSAQDADWDAQAARRAARAAIICATTRLC